MDSSTKMGRVRPFIPTDISEAARLHQRAFGSQKTDRQLEDFLADIFFNHPWVDDTLPSLAYEDATGKMVGYLGVMPRPIVVGDRVVRAAVSHNFVVDPDRRCTLAAIELIRAYLRGPQDLSLADGNSGSRRLMERFGGVALPSYSLRWIRVLRPAASALLLLKRLSPAGRVATVFRPFCAALDRLAVRVPGSPLRPRLGSTVAREIADAALLQLLQQFSKPFLLRPCYGQPQLRWLLTTLEKTRQPGRILRQVAVFAPEGNALGWCLYYVRPRRIGHVLQLVAAPGAETPVLHHLFDDAWRHGAVALTGQVEPRWVEPLSRACCVFDHGGHWTLVHARQRDVLDAFRSGNVFFTRLEGEGWIRFAF